MLITGAASGQDIPPTVEPGAVQQEFQAVPDRYVDTPVAVPSASGPVAPAGAERERLVLNQLVVEGVTVFSSAEVRALYADKIGTEISLADLFGIAQDITRLYSDRGYPLSVAFVPAQEIVGGAARIAVYEGYVAEVEIAGDPGRARPAIERLAAQLTRERPLSTAVLERYVLLANDLPGIAVQAVIDSAPGAPGAVKIVFAVERKRFDIAVNLNNRGSRALGPWRLQASGYLNSIGLPGDQFRGDIVRTPTNDELTYLGGSYDVPIGDDGLRLGIMGSWSDADPGTALLEALAFNTDGWTAGVEASYPLVRRRSRNIVASASFEYREFETRFDDILNSRDVLWVGRARLTLDAATPGGGASSLVLQASKGFNFGGATEERHAFKSRARGSGEFVSLLVDALHVQPLGDTFELALNGRAQLAFDKLLASEECGFGGSGIGRAYDNFEISGDHCLMGLAELRTQPQVLAARIAATPYGFYDAGWVWTHGSAPPGQVRQDDAQSIGAGVRFNLGEAVTAYVEVTKPLQREVALEGSRDGRVFVGVAARR